MPTLGNAAVVCGAVGFQSLTVLISPLRGNLMNGSPSLRSIPENKALVSYSPATGRHLSVASDLKFRTPVPASAAFSERWRILTPVHVHLRDRGPRIDWKQPVAGTEVSVARHMPQEDRHSGSARPPGSTPGPVLRRVVGPGAGQGLRDQLNLSVVSLPASLRLRSATRVELPVTRTVEEGVVRGLIVQGYDRAAETFSFDQAPLRSAQLKGAAELLAHRSVARGDDLGTACQRAAAVMDNRAAYIQTATFSNPFHATRLFASKAAYWTTARQVVTAEAGRYRRAPGGQKAIETLDRSAAVFKAREDLFLETSNHTNFLGDADAILGSRHAPIKPEHITAVFAGDTRLPEQPPDERALAIHCLEVVFDQARQACLRAGARRTEIPARADPEKRFKAEWNTFLNSRSNPTIHNTVVLPARVQVLLNRQDVPGMTAGQMVMECLQTPARSLTVALRSSYDRDRIQGANCHDRAQYRHANNLYHSELRDHLGTPLLSLIRHGVLSATAFTQSGLSHLSDTQLGQAAHDLGPHIQDEGLKRAINHARGRMGELGRYVRTRADESCLPARLRCCDAPPLLDRLRHAANVQRAQEAIHAALSTLPLSKVREILDQVHGGAIPTVTVCSVSLLTPDWFRSVDPRADTHTSNERRMWRDQVAAFEALSAGPREWHLPQIRVHDLARDAGGLLKTAPVRMRVRVLAMNFPVNDWGTGRASLVLGGSDATRAANLDALTQLLGEDFRQAETSFKRRLNPCGGDWALGGIVAAAGEGLDRDSRDRRVRDELARQVGDLYLTGDYRTADKDPYKMAARVVVLAHLSGLPVLMNCKSGKDRTTEAEAHARLLRVQIESSDRVPAYNQPADELQMTQLWDLHSSGGSREIQWWNTNMAGTKLKHKELHAARYGISGQDEHRAHYLGLSGRTKS